MNRLHLCLLKLKNSPFWIGLVLCLLLGLLVTQQISARYAYTAPAAGSRPLRSQYYAIDCPKDNSSVQRMVTPLPASRYLYSNTYGWFDKAHFGTGQPAQLIADLKTVAKSGGGIITVSQGVRDGITGYSANYLVSGNVAEEEVIGVALGIYMDWSVRFEAWQGELPRNVVGPFTPFSIEDLPTQYLGFFDEATDLDLEAVFACYIGEVEAAEEPPHLWIVEETPQPNQEIDLPNVERLINKGFQPMVLTNEGWQRTQWPTPLHLVPIASSSNTWIFESDETWYWR
jgi:hypothetical protein